MTKGLSSSRSSSSKSSSSKSSSSKSSSSKSSKSSDSSSKSSPSMCAMTAAPGCSTFRGGMEMLTISGGFGSGVSNFSDVTRSFGFSAAEGRRRTRLLAAIDSAVSSE
ncbi:hypothetical protein FD723_10050 [Nostoc sp. C052]|nr:hypothetical protein FD723_10050 [Nostoc sp. C052]